MEGVGLVVVGAWWWWWVAGWEIESKGGGGLDGGWPGGVATAKVMVAEARVVAA